MRNLGHTQVHCLKTLAVRPAYTGDFTLETISHQAAHASLRRLEDREFVRRIGEHATTHEILWELTAKGRTALNAALYV